MDGNTLSHLSQPTPTVIIFDCDMHSEAPRRISARNLRWRRSLNLTALGLR
jgi:hypothetical protein